MHSSALGVPAELAGDSDHDFERAVAAEQEVRAAGAQACEGPWEALLVLKRY